MPKIIRWSRKKKGRQAFIVFEPSSGAWIRGTLPDFPSQKIFLILEIYSSRLNISGSYIPLKESVESTEIQPNGRFSP
jgi:hypothetical protein